MPPTNGISYGVIPPSQRDLGVLRLESPGRHLRDRSGPCQFLFRVSLNLKSAQCFADLSDAG